MLSASRLGSELTELMDLPVYAQWSDSGNSLDVRINGLDRPHGFRVNVTQQLSWSTATLYLDNLAASVLGELSSASEGRWEQMFLTEAGFRAMGARIDARLNGHPISSASEAVNQTVRAFSLSARVLQKIPGEMQRETLVSSQAVLTMLVSLLSLDQPSTTPGDADSELAVEGRAISYVGTRYERSRSNRSVAIALHGSSCIVCGFNFGTVYGDVGQGYVEVHHLLPVHMMESPRAVDPRTELVPLCANCHRMAHRRTPPLSPRELLERVQSSQQQVPLP